EIAAPAAEYVPSTLQRPGGPLPVRQPRQSATTAAPLSPSGSLWERAIAPPDVPAEGQDSGGRPIYVWNPTVSTETFPATSGELATPAAEWERSVDEPRWRGPG